MPPVGRARAPFAPPWWLRSGHLQTLWPTLRGRKAPRGIRRERLELPDGDFLDLDWAGPDTGPIVLVLHGLQGSSASPYARGMMDAIARRGWRAAVMHFRGCSGTPNRLARSYHSGDTGDLRHVLAVLDAREPGVFKALVGYSLGGNAMLKWLGEPADERYGVCAAAAVSVPYDLDLVARRLEHGPSRFYQWYLVRSMRRSVQRKFASRSTPIDLSDAHRWRTFRQFDHNVTAPLHGFDGVDDYYARSSSRQFLRAIDTPTLLIHALDDPFMTPAVVPCADELSPSVKLELSGHGGHVGFVQTRRPGRPRYWLEERVPEFLENHLDVA